MSQISTIQAGVNQAFKALGNLVGTFTLQRNNTVFDPMTSNVTSTVTNYVGEGVYDQSQKKYLALTELSQDKIRVWLKITEEPKLSDRLICPDGTNRSILEVRPVQANTTVFVYEVICGA